MKGTINKFIIKNGHCPERVEQIHCELGTPCILVYNDDTCVGVVHLHEQSVKAYGQAEICFFDKYKDLYGKWHRMFESEQQRTNNQPQMSIKEQRILFANLQSYLKNNDEFVYYGKIKNKK